MISDNYIYENKIIDIPVILKNIALNKGMFR